MGGAVTERLAYDPWGKRRKDNGQIDKLGVWVGQNTGRGYGNTMESSLTRSM